MTAGSPDRPVIVLVPGAWMGAWIWDDTARRLRARGYEAIALTLPGLEADTPAAEAAAVTLDDHVERVLDLIDRERLAAVVLVAHSYSGVVVGQVADRAADVVRRSVHIGSFLPRNGRALLDDWGPDADARQAERDQIGADGMLWAPPTEADLEGEADLTAAQRSWLAAGFVAHPGRTVLDPAVLARPVTDQHLTFVAGAPTGSDPRVDLPPELRGALPSRWQLRTMTGGHWPMLTRTDELVAHLDEAAAG